MRMRATIILLGLGVVLFPIVFALFWRLAGGSFDKLPAAALGSGSFPFPFVFLPFALLAFTALLSLLIARSLRLSLDRLARVASRLAAGDLDTPVEATGREDVARLGEALEALRLSLRDERGRRSRLIMGVSHDFRTPIALIRGYAEALKDRVAPDRGTEEHYLDVIKDKTGQLEALVDDLLGYVRMEGDQRRSPPPLVELRPFFASLAADFAGDSAMGGRTFEFRDHSSGEPVAHLDENAARRAFRNLFVNALRYTKPGGGITMEIIHVGGQISVSLCDDGIGIAAEDLASVFEPFFRGKNVGSRQGSGLGLAIAKSVADSHGWRISCTSDPGLETRFTVAIPLES